MQVPELVMTPTPGIISGRSKSLPECASIGNVPKLGLTFVSGGMSYCHEGEFLFVTNLKNGVDQYRLSTMEHVRCLKHPIITNVPQQLSFIPTHHILLTGGDDGAARMYDMQSGLLQERLQHSEDQMRLV